jgi:hypothetical protein
MKAVFSAENAAGSRSSYTSQLETATYGAETARNFIETRDTLHP